MKYYDLNKRVSYAIITISSICLLLWIIIIALHGSKMQINNVQLNPYFMSAINCGFTYPLASPASMPVQSNFQVGATITTVNLIYTDYIVGYYFIFHKANVAFLILTGIWEINVLVISILLLLKSREPYRQACHLWSERNLKINLNIFGFLGFISSLVYFGYALNFNVNMKNTTCLALQLYAQSYGPQTIVGGILCPLCLSIYFITIRIKQDTYRDKTIGRGQQITKQNLLTTQVNQQAQKIIAQRLASLPKINQLKQTQMVEYQPPVNFNLSEYQSKPISIFQGQNKLSDSINRQLASNIQGFTNKTPPKTKSAFQKDFQQRYDQFGRVRKFVANPVQIQQIQLQIKDKLYLLKLKEEQRKRLQQKQLKRLNKQVQKQQMILDFLNNDEPVTYKNYPTSGKKPRLKLFKNRYSNPVSDLKKEWGYK